MTLQFAMFVLTVWSVTRLLTLDGFAPFRVPRDWIIARGTTPDGEHRWYAYLAMCPWCVSFWVGIGVWAAGVLLTDLEFPAPAAWILSARVLTGVFDLIEDRLQA